MQDDDFDSQPTAVWKRSNEPVQARPSPGSKPPVAEPPPALLYLFGEACNMPEARWGSVCSPDGAVYRNFTRVSRPGFGPRFASGNSAAPKPAATGLEVSREDDGWLLELVFDDTRLDYPTLHSRLRLLLEQWELR